MAKNVALSNDAYGTLEKLKRNGESFSDVVMRLANKEGKPNIMDLAGAWKDDREIGKIFDKILEDRHRFYRRQFKW
jgi:predicted CopG family antitoxin